MTAKWTFSCGSKGQLISKAIYGLLTSPKKRTDEFVLFAFLLFTANKSNSSVRFLGESTASQSAFRFYLTFRRIIRKHIELGKRIPFPFFQIAIYTVIEKIKNCHDHRRCLFIKIGTQFIRLNLEQGKFCRNTNTRYTNDLQSLFPCKFDQK